MLICEHSEQHTHQSTIVSTVVQQTLELSQEQVEDLLQLRRLYLAKRAQLMKSREQQMEQMRNAGNGLHPGDVMTRMSRLATKLKVNAAEDYRVYNRTVCALVRGVSILASLTDLAALFVLNAYQMPDLMKHSNTLTAHCHICR